MNRKGKPKARAASQQGGPGTAKEGAGTPDAAFSGGDVASRVEQGVEGAPEWVAVRIGEAEFGIPIGLVREVLHPPRISRVPLTPPSVLGVVSVRREVVPVIDLGERLLARASAAGRLVVVNHGADAEPVGLLVDAVSGLIPRGAKAPGPPSQEVDASVEEGVIAGVIEFRDRSIAILQLDRVLDIPLGATEEAR